MIRRVGPLLIILALGTVLLLDAVSETVAITPPGGAESASLVDRWLQAMAGAGANRGWKYLSVELQAEAFGGDESLYLAEVEAVDWEAVRWWQPLAPIERPTRSLPMCPVPGSGLPVLRRCRAPDRQGAARSCSTQTQGRCGRLPISSGGPGRRAATPAFGSRSSTRLAWCRRSAGAATSHRWWAMSRSPTSRPARSVWPGSAPTAPTPFRSSSAAIEVRLTWSWSWSSAPECTAPRARGLTSRCCGSRTRSRRTRSWPRGADNPPFRNRAGERRPGVLLRPRLNKAPRSRPAEFHEHQGGAGWSDGGWISHLGGHAHAQTLGQAPNAHRRGTTAGRGRRASPNGLPRRGSALSPWQRGPPGRKAPPA